MLDPHMTEDELAEQADRYGHNYFRTCRQTPIRIDDTLDLRTALEEARKARTMLVTQRMVEGMATGGTYEAEKALTFQLEQASEDAKAQAQAAFYRTTGMWPYQLHDLNL